MMATAGLSPAGLTRLHDRLAAHVDRREVPGLIALVARGADVHVELLGNPALDDASPLRRDAIFRIASLTKPIVGAGAMTLVDEGLVSVDEPVEKYLPELANRNVLRSPEGPLNDTVPAQRPITVEDLLTFRLGFGIIMAPPRSYPIQIAEEELDLKTLGPPWPPPPLTSDEWLARFASLPLMDQPGEVWRYNTGARVLGILIERVTDKPLEEFLRSYIFEPLGMKDTSFSAPSSEQSRLTAAYFPDPASGDLRLLDPPIGGMWSKPPMSADASGMLVSTLDDFWAFVQMLLGNGTYQGHQVLSPASVAAMTRNHLTDGQRAPNTLFLGEHGGWGYCMATPGPLSGEPPVPWGFGWDGGTGATWRSDPVRGLSGILFTQRAMASPAPPPVFVDFWDAAYGAIDQES